MGIVDKNQWAIGSALLVHREMNIRAVLPTGKKAKERKRDPLLMLSPGNMHPGSKRFPDQYVDRSHLNGPES